MSLMVLCASWPAVAGAEPLPLLKHSDVVFMYQASTEVYREYGATVLAWGGTPNEQSLKASREAGVTFFGSVGMVTEFARFIDEFPGYEQAICLDAEGNRLKVPWLWDHTHKGIPAYWFCTNQPIFREYLRNRVTETVKAGADGVHVDDHLGTAGNSWLGGCYCDRCMEGFRAFLKDSATPEELAQAGVTDLAQLDYRALVQEWLAAHPDRLKNLWERPLAHQFAVFESRAAAAFMMELRNLAAGVAGRPMPMSANAGVPHVSHLSDYQALDFLSCEVDQKAGERKGHDGVVLAYKVAEALGRPVCATASGWDWAFVKEQNLPGLVRLWGAQAYALGHFFMAPHHQWCYTEEKGTHWYEGPAAEYAWLYRFVREQAGLFDGYETVADLGVVIPAGTLRNNLGEATELTAALSGANIPFRILLGGDDMLPCALPADGLRRCTTLIVLGGEALTPEDRATLAQAKPRGGVLEWKAGEPIPPALGRPIEVQGAGNVWAVPRAKADQPGEPAVLQLVNRSYDAATDKVVPVRDLRIAVASALFGRESFSEAVLHQPGQEARALTVVAGGGEVTVTVPELGLWGVLELR